MSDGWDVEYGEWGSDAPPTSPEAVAPPAPAAWSTECDSGCQAAFAEQPTSSSGGMGDAPGGWIVIAFLAGCVFNSLLWRLRIMKRAAKKAISL